MTASTLTMTRPAKHLTLMQRLVTLLLLFALLVPVLGAQQKPRDKAVDDRHTEEAQRKAQAVDILKGVVESAADIQDTLSRVAVLTGALDLLWKHDEVYARSNFIKAAANLSDRFALDATQGNERSEIRASMGVLLRSFARHDSQAAGVQLSKFQKLLEDVLKGNTLSPNERLSIAQAGLESDAAQSTALAAKILEGSVPGSFPSYLNELEQRDPAAAASLFRVAVSILSSGRVYNPIHVTVLSTYVFRESQMSVPIARGGRDGLPFEFGMYAGPLSPPSRELNRILVASYLAASGSYLNAEANGLEQRDNPDPMHVALILFLVKKLAGYADRLSLDGGQNWRLLDSKYTMLAERAKLGDQTVRDLASVAQRIVTENTVFQFDSGEAAFANAEKVKDPAARAELMATGIHQQIDEGKYAEAIQKIDDIKDEKIREQLNVYLSFRMAETSLKKLDWYSFNSQVNRVSDARLRTFLTLSAAVAANDAGKKKISSDFLLTAMALFSKIEDSGARAAALVTAAGILYSTADASWNGQVLTEAVNAINHASRYNGREYEVTLEVAKAKMRLQVPKGDLNHCFVEAAKRDWSGALVAAQSIESKTLRSQAYIAACASVL